MITLEKSYKINFFWKKNEDQINTFKVTKKASSPLKKMFSKKKFIPAYLCQYDLQNGVRKFFKNKWISRYLSFGDLKVLKNCSSQKIIHKTRLIKNQENSAHRFGDNYLTNHLVKFLQDSIKP